MNEFDLINFFLKQFSFNYDKNVIFGIGDDAACLNVPSGMHLLVSTDTLVLNTHFLDSWDPYDIAYKAVVVNMSDIIAMAGNPCWISLSLTMPNLDFNWIKRFSNGFYDVLKKYNIILIGGNFARGFLSITITIHGLVPRNKALYRNGAKCGDPIYVSGKLGIPYMVEKYLKKKYILKEDKDILFKKIKNPIPKLELITFLQNYASAAIDISDGLSADLNHICNASNVGACLVESFIPIHPLVVKYASSDAINLALYGGDEYELCFSIRSGMENYFLNSLKKHSIICYKIGMIEDQLGLRIVKNNKIKFIKSYGYKHFY
ncbi:thiamine-phosphate kinase [Candidatus Legionella polyplacis]|uniref:thiamine-phosphate kinase n=1 Tax=Candidatus Legionella polyplacis TaxID=2005262 RepID=UPI000C1EECEF|nr:thiamine-phosphate kinase [Candidatus Legionella polyplacis]ATW02061.1 thiamine-phosphate kinase [Candidatus Legionella polyplacis]